MTNEERKLLDKLSKMELPEYERELNVLLETYDFDNCSEDFDDEFRYQMARKYLKDFENDDTPFEESLDRWLDSLTEEEREAFLNEDWSELDEL